MHNSKKIIDCNGASGSCGAGDLADASSRYEEGNLAGASGWYGDGDLDCEFSSADRRTDLFP
jgi:hypothetical protein